MRQNRIRNDSYEKGVYIEIVIIIFDVIEFGVIDLVQLITHVRSIAQYDNRLMRS